MTVSHGEKRRCENNGNAKKRREYTHANGVCRSRLESDSVPSPSSSLSNLSISSSSISGSEASSCLWAGRLNFLAIAGLKDKVWPGMAEGALDLCGCLFNDGTLGLDCSLGDELGGNDGFIRLGFGVSDMMVGMSGLVRPLVAPTGVPPSLLGKGWGRIEVAGGGGDLNEEGGGDDVFDFLTGCDGTDCGGSGN